MKHQIFTINDMKVGCKLSYKGWRIILRCFMLRFFFDQVWDFLYISFLVPFALQLQQFGTRTRHFAVFATYWNVHTFWHVDLPFCTVFAILCGTSTSHVAWYLPHFGTSDVHVTWYLRHFGTWTFHVAWLLMHVRTSNFHFACDCYMLVVIVLVVVIVLIVFLPLKIIITLVLFVGSWKAIFV